MIYVGSDFKNSGVKVKVVNGGVLQPENVCAEYWNGSAWFPVNYMATNSDFPYDQRGWNIATQSATSEQWRFNFDPYNLNADFETTVIDGRSKYWARFRVIADVQLVPVLEQVKLHTNRFEVNATGFTEYFGISRYKQTVASGVDHLIGNKAGTPKNENVSYIIDGGEPAAGVIADYKVNKFEDGNNDSTIFVLDVVEGIDTSIPLEVSVSWYVKGTGLGDVCFTLEKIAVGDGFVYDGNAAITGSTTATTTIATDQNLIRHTSKLFIDINEATVDTAYLMVVRRNSAPGNGTDTLLEDVVMTHFQVNGYFWKP
jgi:hypothetical protein